MKHKDWVLRALVEKKRELLSDLLRLSRRSMVLQTEVEQRANLEARAKLIAQLEKNDQALDYREQQIQKLAKGEERGVYREIEFLLRSIQHNNQASLLGLEQGLSALEKERVRLEQGAKVGSYLQMGKAKRQIPAKQKVVPLRSGKYGP